MKNLFLFLLIIAFISPIQAQKKTEADIFSAPTFSGLKFRSIGPAFYVGKNR
jgi:hypothetical protein